MGPPRVNEGSSFGPDVLKVVSKAFDEAWGVVAAKFTPEEHELARHTLAEALMAGVREDSDDVQRLRDTGIRAMQMKYPICFGGCRKPDKEKGGE